MTSPARRAVKGSSMTSGSPPISFSARSRIGFGTAKGMTLTVASS